MGRDKARHLASAPICRRPQVGRPFRSGSGRVRVVRPAPSLDRGDRSTQTRTCHLSSERAGLLIRLRKHIVGASPTTSSNFTSRCGGYSRRATLRTWCPKGRVGASPITGTKLVPVWRKWQTQGPQDSLPFGASQFKSGVGHHRSVAELGRRAGLRCRCRKTGGFDPHRCDQTFPIGKIQISAGSAAAESSRSGNRDHAGWRECAGWVVSPAGWVRAPRLVPNWGCSSAEERLFCKQRVGGSNPSISTIGRLGPEHKGKPVRAPVSRLLGAAVEARQRNSGALAESGYCSGLENRRGSEGSPSVRVGRAPPKFGWLAESGLRHPLGRRADPSGSRRFKSCAIRHEEGWPRPTKTARP